MLRLHCLGHFQLEINNQVVTLPTRKTAVLLAYLALHPTAHLREALVTRFWGDFGEAEARRSLRTALSALRKLLGDTALLTDRETVQFNPAYPLWLDVAALRQQQTADPSQLDLALYRGDLLDGFYDEWILRERDEVRQLYISLLLRQTQHWRAQGDYTQAIAAARQILTLDPAEETAHQHLLFCYTVVGDRQAARYQYEACVRTLREELGVEPAPVTVALYRRSQQPPLSTRTTAVQNNLPLPLSSFIGRTQEITRLQTLLVGNHTSAQQALTRLVTVTGPGGCGKTRLAIQVARGLLDHFVDGIWWVDLAALKEAAQVTQAVAKVLGIEQGGQPSLLDGLLNNLRRRQTLLVLDNCEHLVTACADLAEQLLTHCADLKVLATSSEALGLFGETSWLVPSLTLPATPLRLPADYLEYEAIRLFVERAGATHREFALSAANAPAIVHICRQLDGIPLAIELAAARVKLMTVEQIAARLTSVIGTRFDLLTDGSRTVLPRQQTLRATIEWSYALLTEAEQRLLQQLVVFAGGWALEAAEATGAAVTAPHPVAVVLARLVDKSLVLVEAQDEVARYRMLETVRQYTYEQLENTGTIAIARDRHLLYFQQLAAQAEPELWRAGQLTWLRHLKTEAENLRAALTWSLQHEPPVSERLLRGASLATALIFHWKLHSDWVEGRFWLQLVDQMLGDRLQSVDVAQHHRAISLRAKALYGAGVLAWHQGRQTESWQLLETSMSFWRTVDNRGGFYRAQVFLADLYFLQEDVTTAQTLWQECCAYFRQIHDDWFLAESTFFLGYAERRMDHLAEATPYYGAAIAVLQSLGERWLYSLSVSHLGLIAFAQGDYVTAQRHIEQRLLMGREFNLKQHIYTALDFLADIAQAQGNLRQIAALWRAAMTIKQQAGVDPLAILVDKLGIIAQVCTMDGQIEQAVRFFAAHRAYASTPGYEDEKTRHTHDQLLVELRTRLGEATFATTWHAGCALTPEQALAEALAEG